MKEPIFVLRTEMGDTELGPLSEALPTMIDMAELCLSAYRDAHGIACTAMMKRFSEMLDSVPPEAKDIPTPVLAGLMAFNALAYAVTTFRVATEQFGMEMHLIVTAAPPTTTTTIQ